MVAPVQYTAGEISAQRPPPLDKGDLGRITPHSLHWAKSAKRDSGRGRRVQTSIFPMLKLKFFFPSKYFIDQSALIIFN